MHRRLAAETHGAAFQPLLQRLRRGILHAQHLPVAAVKYRQALEHVVHLFGAEGQLDLLATDLRPALKEAHAMLVERHVGNGQGRHGAFPPCRCSALLSMT